MNNDNRWIVIIVVVLLVLCACAAVVCVGAGGLGFWWASQQSTSMPTIEFEFDTSSDDAQATPVPSEPMPTVSPERLDETLKTLNESVVPGNDPLALAERLKGIANIPPTVEPPAQPLKVGDARKFWVTNSDDNSTTQADATLQYITPHVYFWIEDGGKFDKGDLKKLVETFENEIYPTDREFFGSEWTPGIDGDPHLYILFVRNIGSNIAGYFSSGDEVPPQANTYSNAHEIFMLSADNLVLGEEYAYSVLAHEFQHMIHWYRDRNEESWVNEGFSELAVYLNGYQTGGMDSMFASNPDIQLTDWPNDDSARTAHYGSSFLFFTYFLDRFGSDVTQALVKDAQNGMSSIDTVLAQNAADKNVRADDVFLDWAVTNLLQDPDVGDGRFAYSKYDAPQPDVTEQVDSCPMDWETRTVSQYGTDYIAVDCDGSYTLEFSGSQQVRVLPADPHSGAYAFWSNKGDESDMSLTQTFDFSQVQGKLTLSYWTWYDLEKDYDYAYVVASEDGETWKILQAPSTTDSNPAGNSYGWGYNGESDWIQEQVDISQYAGKKVQLRFEYITDAAVNGEGMLLDDIEIPEINYRTDFEQDTGGWEGAGFVRIQNALAQHFRLALIERGKQTNVRYVDLSTDEKVSIPLQIGGDVKDVVLVVTGVTRFTRQPAEYNFRVAP